MAPFQTPKIAAKALFPNSAIKAGLDEHNQMATRFDRIRKLAGGKNKKRKTRKKRKRTHRRTYKKGGSKSCACGSTPANIISYPAGSSTSMSPNPNANLANAQQVFANSKCASTGDVMGDSWGQTGGSLGKFMENLNNMAGGYETSNDDCPPPLKGCFIQDGNNYAWLKFPHPDQSDEYDYFALLVRNMDEPDIEDEDAWILVPWFGYSNILIKIRMEKDEDGKYVDHFPDSIPDPTSPMVVDGPEQLAMEHDLDSESDQEGGKKRMKRKTRRRRSNKKRKTKKRRHRKRKKKGGKKNKSRTSSSPPSSPTLSSKNIPSEGEGKDEVSSDLNENVNLLQEQQENIKHKVNENINQIKWSNRESVNAFRKALIALMQGIEPEHNENTEEHSLKLGKTPSGRYQEIKRSN